MNNQDAKSAAIKTLAIIGFIGAVVLALWLVVQVVTFIPTVFTNLASIVDSMSGRERTFSVELEKNIVNSGETTRILWKKERGQGTYEFTYACTEGISAEVREDGDITLLDCGESHTVVPGKIAERGAGTDANGSRETFEVIFKSEKQRFSDVTLTFAFIPENGTSEESYTKTAVLTVVNATIPLVTARTTPPKEREVTTPKPSITPASTPVRTSKPQPIYYRTVPVTKTAYPVSNPNGFTDLALDYIAIGRVSGGVFTRYTSLEEGERGAIQVSVKNIGTKTSDFWKLKGTLPVDDEHFTSSTQSPLLPGERAILTISFDDVSDEEEIEMEIVTDRDSTSSNDSFERDININ